ncbi:MAG: SDR family oxidoreductase [Thermoplasmata archaeon]
MKYGQSLKDKTAVVTGSSEGIGKEISLKLAEEGCKIVLCSRNEKKLKDVADLIDNEESVFVVPTDIRREEQVKHMVCKTLEHFAGIDILVNNAGIIRYGDMDDFSTKDYKATMETNVDGTFYATREALPHIRESKGNIVFVGSFDSNHPRSFNPIYAASKWWVKGFAHSIEAIYGKDGVAVTLVNPSEVRTEIPSEEGIAYRDKFRKGEVLEPEEVAETVVFALKRSKNTTLSQLNIYRRNKLSDFF